MSFGTALVIIVAILAMTAARIAKYRAGADSPHYRGNHHPNLPSARESELTREVDDLRQRIAVLERIVTDNRHSTSIAAEIEALRDK